MYSRGRSSNLSFFITVLSISLLFVSPNLTTGSSLEGGDNEEGTLDVDSIYWPFLGRDAYHNFKGETLKRGLMDPMVDWDHSENSTALGAVFGDFSSNVDFVGVSKSIVVGVVDSNQTHISIYQGGTGEVIWSVDVRDVEGRITNRLYVAPALLDTDDDSRLEVACSITDGNLFQMVLFEPNITLESSGFSYDEDAQYYERIWITELGPIGSVRFSSPIAHDLDSNGVEDIIFGAGNTLYALFGDNGSVMWSIDVGPIGEILSTPAIYPSASLKRIVINSLSLSPTIKDLKTTTVNFQGEHLNNVSRRLNYVLTFSGPVPIPVIGDVVGDSLPEIVISYPSTSMGRISVYDYSLDGLIEISDILGYMDSSCSLGDMDGDSKKEILIQSKYSTTRWIMSMYCFEVTVSGSTYSSNEVWRTEGTIQGPSTDRLHASPLICDMDMDPGPDVVFPGNGWLYAVTSEGDQLWNLSVEDHLFRGGGIIGDLSTEDFTSLYIDGYMVTQQRIDLYIDEPIPENIYLSEESPVEGQSVNVNCLVKNSGNYPARDVVVEFIDSYGGEDETIGFDILDEVATTAEARVEWSPAGSGDHTIIVVLDPDNNITEIEEDNNLESRVFQVGAAKSDLSVSNITYVRGDGEVIDGKNRHPVHGDPSMVQAEIVNLGYKPAQDVQVWAFVNDLTLDPKVADEIPGGEKVNITFDWTPDQPDGGEVSVGIYVDHPDLVPPQDQIDESDETNNNLTTDVLVKSTDTGSFSYIISGYVSDTSSDPIEDVMVTIHNNRTGEEISVRSEGNGFYEGDLRSLESGYLDTDEVSLFYRKMEMWGREFIRVYSEDGGKIINVTLSDVPTTGISMSPQGETHLEVDSGAAKVVRFSVVNTGNAPGVVSLEISVTVIEGDTSPSSWQTSVEPNDFTLNGSEEETVSLRIDVPSMAEPGDSASIGIIGLIEGEGSHQANLTYGLDVRVNAELYHEFKSDRNRTVNLGTGEVEPVRFDIYLNNRGNIPLNWSVSVSGDLLLLSDVEPASGILEPGEVQWVYVTVTVPAVEDSYDGDIELVSEDSSLEIFWDVRVDVVIPNVRIGNEIIVEPPDGNLGEEVTISAKVINDGGVDVPSFSCSLVVDSSLEVDKEVPDGVKIGEDVSVVFLWTPEEVGEHALNINIDSGNDIAESNEDDNQIGTTLSYAPDLIVKSFSLSDMEVSSGDDVTCFVEVENEGNAPVLGGFVLTVHLGTVDGKELARRSVSKNLDPISSSSTKEEIIFEAPDEGGMVTIYAVISTGESSMDDPENNYDQIQLEVKSEEDGGVNPLIIAGILAGIVLVIAVAAFFFLRSRKEMEPPPDVSEPSESEEEKSEEEPPIEEDSEEEPVLEMSIREDEETSPPEEEDVIMAAVVEDETPEEEFYGEEISEEEGGPLPPEEEEMIPEV